MGNAEYMGLVSKLKNKMKVLLCLALLFAVSQANDAMVKANLHKITDMKMENLKLRLRNGAKMEDIIAEPPASTEDCGWATGLSCATSIGWAVWDCVGLVANPAEIMSCVEDVIGAGDSCWPCICWVIEWLLGDGYC